jgi:hypothetical protein
MVNNSTNINKITDNKKDPITLEIQILFSMSSYHPFEQYHAAYFFRKSSGFFRSEGENRKHLYQIKQVTDH